MNSPVIPFGRPRPERADAARNRELLLETMRAMIAEDGVEKLTMDGLAEQAGLGKGTVFRRFGSRAGIFRALIDEDERRFQESVLAGPPPLGPGAGPVERMVAYGRARTAFLVERHAIARASLERDHPAPAGEGNFSRVHLRMLIGLADRELADPDTLSVQLASALEGAFLLFLQDPGSDDRALEGAVRPVADSWQLLIERLFRP
ncbi:TetR/AcrR family transcriptional regulator [Actinocorallia populi]|uniref:TetR/AcrR family transcriptional regulator n=1 Tax=Actinocorallia populi TaxID=2079200 RepID=UPI000D08FB1F|nr:TetR/AcrR family transcriptional regulator [Actinocorallia populi]